MSGNNSVIDVTITRSCDIYMTGRIMQVSGMFDVPVQEKLSHEWRIKMDLSGDWQIGLIVGSSGSGKSTMAKQIWPEEYADSELEWDHDRAVIDNIRNDMSVEEIAKAFDSVGFSTIPSWFKPYRVLSNGEKFRVTLARRILEDDYIVYDEFSSVVDRQVAKIASYAVQKYIRRQPAKKFVAVTCHSDVIDWLMPDWIYYTDEQRFERRYLQRIERPKLDMSIRRCNYATWQKFASYHYMSRELNRSARCYAIYHGDDAVSFAGLLYRPILHGKYKMPIYGVSRLVTLPDWQGIGLSWVLLKYLGSYLYTRNMRLRTYPAHPILVRKYQQSQDWRKIKKYGDITSRNYQTKKSGKKTGAFGGRFNAVFEWHGRCQIADGEIKMIDRMWHEKV